MHEAKLLSHVDHTLLKQTATWADIEKICREGLRYRTASVCIPPSYVKQAAEFLEGKLPVGTVIGFPNGYQTTAVKQAEAAQAVAAGADEIDMVINVGALKDKDYEYVKKEIEEIRDQIDGKTLKVIIETSLLTKEEIIKMTEICNETFVNFIKTNTGFGKRGVTLEDVELINKHKNDILEIKASGGIKTFKQMNELIEAGATRIGTSNSVEIVTHMNCDCEGKCDHCEEEK